jgi:hypothetical protein
MHPAGRRARIVWQQMIVEPTPTNPRSPIRRALRLAALVLPVVLFAAVLGAGLLGPRPEPPAPPPTAAAVAAPVEPASASPTNPAPPGVVTMGQPGPSTQFGDQFPAAVANLSVTQIPALLQARRDGRDKPVVAVAGYLRAWADPQLCTDPVPGLPGVGCVRTAILADVSWSNPGSGVFSGMGPHLHGVIPPGVAIPDTAVGLAPRDGEPPPPVVVIGHFAAGPTACPGDDPACEEPFTIERVVWASGQRLTLGRQVEDQLAASGNEPMVVDPAVTASRALGPVTTLLRMVLVEPAALANVDAVAAAEAPAATARTRDPVWYVRGLDVPYDPLTGPTYGRTAPVIRWAVIDQASGTVLASGEASATPTPPATPTG